MAPTRKKNTRGARRRNVETERVPLRLTLSHLVTFDRYVTSSDALSDEEKREYLGRPQRERLRSAEAVINGILDEERRKLDAELEQRERERRELDVEAFISAWERLEAAREYVEVYIGEEFRRPRETAEQIEEILRNVEAAQAERDRLSEALAEATRGHGVLKNARSRWDAATRWAVVEYITPVFRDGTLRRESERDFACLDELLGCDEGAVAEAVAFWASRARACGGPANAARHAVARALAIDESAIRRGRQRGLEPMHHERVEAHVRVAREPRTSMTVALRGERSRDRWGRAERGLGLAHALHHVDDDHEMKRKNKP